MTAPSAPDPVTLIVGMLAREPALFDAAGQRLAERFGPIDLSSPVLDFDFTDYYEPEMGPDLKRKFVSFARKIDPAEIAGIKLATNELEQELAPLDASVPNKVPAAAPLMTSIRSMSDGFMSLSRDVPILELPAKLLFIRTPSM